MPSQAVICREHVVLLRAVERRDSDKAFQVPFCGGENGNHLWILPVAFLGNIHALARYCIEADPQGGKCLPN